MHLLQCLLALSSGVSAFIPYTLELPPDSSESVPQRRSSSGDRPKSLVIRRVPVRRDNQYKMLHSQNSSTPNTAALDQDGNDRSYISAVNVGSQNQTLWMLLDTGAGNTWLFASDCTTEACKMHNTFGEQASSSLQMTGDRWNVGYGTGKVSGFLGSDTLSIANLEVEMTFGLASDASDELKSYPMDGILGLGRAEKGVFGHDTFMDVVAKKELLKSNIVSVSLSRGQDKIQDGSVTFGDVDKSKFTGDITYTDTVKNTDQWRIPLDDASVDGSACQFSEKSAIMDTGTSFMLIPPADAKALHGKIPGAKPYSDTGYLLPCDSTAEVNLTFSGVSYTISPKDYVGSKTNDNCVSTIVGKSIFGDDIWLVGDVFLKNVYTVFDFDKSRIGLAQRTYATDSKGSDSNSNPTTGSGSEATTTSTAMTGEISSTGATSSSTSSSSSSNETASGEASNIGPRFSWPILTALCVVGLGLM
ncbi:hypothetical protein EYZ11_011217 [Aspergillus tanneri]|uniref:Peptidase A1 domain-containing protein n=1 Tax=Aspergillus tanneri TaxID=1220188 RepID=A0A4V3UN07_9EURO|nr:uncharacterized protein ATNIH1004_005031 [Aspergillus tanneri]KAA8649136.1 hypothetical protein ATNIH1004_005031 [Aspergillus tanneri]THC89334.1 hypothetical protein EYZ11_011217 [Aspergillus tanneri]